MAETRLAAGDTKRGRRARTRRVLSALSRAWRSAEDVRANPSVKINQEDDLQWLWMKWRQ